MLHKYYVNFCGALHSLTHRKITNYLLINVFFTAIGFNHVSDHVFIAQLF